MQGYAVLDLETTGFSPQHDGSSRFCVHVRRWEHRREWCTLINPQRDMGRSRACIAAADVLAAPTSLKCAVSGELLAGVY